ncbi:E3 ubiquitin-protein ligase MIB2-like isoform X1 [Octopus vulgaris]|uniref:RING-type E3 ubiquitin transferase n=1 Tax=Octopus vulgaris TaxID=6645 RepID=A0AA36BV05_OCTVU|nr:E3 ubiquitin-protein ligase MIB2-like isoform X1 [Octopus vulgaris]
MGATQSTFRSGDQFVEETGIVESVHTSGDIIVKYESHHNLTLCLNPAALKKVLGETGTIRQVFPDGDLIVSMSGKIFLFNPLCCERESGGMLSEEEDIEKLVPSLSMNSDFTDLLSFSQEHTEEFEIQYQDFGIGDTVKIIDDIEKVIEYQDGHGGWADIMETILGEKAEVKVVLPNDDLLVLMPGGIWRLNPKCCKNVSDSDDSETSSDSDVSETSSDSDDSDSDSGRPRIQESPKNALFQKSIPKDLDTIVQSASRSEIENVPEFIKSERSKIDVKCSGITTLQVASGKGYKDVVSLLLEAGENLEVQDEDGDTALHYSSYRDQPEIMEILLSKGANTEAVNKRQLTALHIAVIKEFVKCVRVLLEYSAADISGNTPLHLAIMNENDDIVDMLINDSKIDFTIRNKRGFNALHHAALNGNIFATERILEKHRDIVDVKKDDGFTALHVAAVNGRKDIIKTLLTVGQAQIDIREDDQMTPLHLAVRECYMGSIELLISKEADINAKDRDGNTCLHLAVSNRTKPIRKDSEILYKVRTQFNLGKDAPDWFVIACYLVFHGVKRYHENHRGKTALDIINNESLGKDLLKFHSKSIFHCSSRSIVVYK